MGQYIVIRASSGYETIIVTFEENKKTKHYLHDDRIYRNSGIVFKEISKKEAERYFSGQADGMGFGVFPRKFFTSLEEIEEWRKEARLQAYRELKKTMKKSK